MTPFICFLTILVVIVGYQIIIANKNASLEATKEESFKKQILIEGLEYNLRKVKDNIAVAQRLIIYTGMLQHMKLALSCTGLCAILWTVIGYTNYIEDKHSSRIEDYPELYVQAPPKNLWYGGFWWLRNDIGKESRIKALEKAIILCKAHLLHHS